MNRERGQADWQGALGLGQGRADGGSRETSGDAVGERGADSEYRL